MCRKNVQYSVYFKLHSDRIQGSPIPSDNPENYAKVKKNVLQTIGVLLKKPDQSEFLSEETEISYVDPGYNEKK